MNDVGQSLKTMRDAAPLVQNITNYVAMNVMANVMLAAGASPAMVHAQEESAEFAGLAQALTINIGTLSPDWIASMRAAAAAAAQAGNPWVLDPVAVGATSYRRRTGAELLALNPSVVRGNASEILALSGADAAGKGADAADAVATAERAARDLAARTGGVVAVTGPVDFVTDGARGWRLRGGHPMMPRVTALGCSLTGLVAAFCVGQPHAEATVAALAFFKLAGQRAGAASRGPGGFQTALLDALATITPKELAAEAQVEPL